MIPVGTLAAGVLAHVDGRGKVQPVGEKWAVDWSVLAEDRWHIPASEVAVRQRLLDDTPVVETLMRVPSGDVVHRVYGTVDGVVIEVENQSPLPVALQLEAGRKARLSLPKPSAEPGKLVWPLSHRTLLRFVVGDADPASVPAAEQVARGWQVQAAQGARFVVPDERMQSELDAGRCFALLTGDPMALARFGYGDEAATALLRVADRPADAATISAAAEHWRLYGNRDVAIMLAPAVAEGADRGGSPEDAAVVLDAAGETQAAAVARRRTGAPPPVSPLAALRDGLVRDGLDLAPVVPDAWLGQGWEVHDAPTAHGLVSYAVRWHGDRPALLWEVERDCTVRAPGLDADWSSTARRGDALLAARPTPVTLRRAASR